tara:strand:- start:150 stop:533 length:384 start_codon:yes stop_codon:yes gene_type:complete
MIFYQMGDFVVVCVFIGHFALGVLVIYYWRWYRGISGKLLPFSYCILHVQMAMKYLDSYFGYMDETQNLLFNSIVFLNVSISIVLFVVQFNAKEKRGQVEIIKTAERLEQLEKRLSDRIGRDKEQDR